MYSNQYQSVPEGHPSARPFSFESQQSPAPQSTSSQQRQVSHFQELRNDSHEHNFPERPFSYVETPIEDSTQDFDQTPGRVFHSSAAQQQHQPPQSNTSSPHEPVAAPSASSAAPPAFNPLEMSQRYPDEKMRPPEEPHPAVYAVPPEPINPTSSSDGVVPQQSSEVSTSYAPPHHIQQAVRSPVPMRNESDARATVISSRTRSSQQLDQMHVTNEKPKEKEYRPYDGNVPQSPITSTIPFSPLNLDGSVGNPDLLERHMPGQVGHPNMTPSSPSWLHGLCACPGSDLGTCLTGIFCPCVIYSKALYRLNKRSKRGDPTDLLGFSACNGHCMLFGVACGCQGLLTALLRGRVRRLYKVDGSFGDDFAAGCCCCCCAVIQSEREIRAREEKHRQFAGPGLAAYHPVDEMSYTRQ